jgi:hypothetical protein
MVKFKHGRRKVQIRALIRNINVLNTILLLITVVFIFHIFLPRLEPQVKYKIPPVKNPLGKEQEKIPFENRNPSITEYALVSEKNLFNPDRIIPVEKKEAGQQSLPKPDFLLYGTLLSKDVNLAYIEDLKALRNTPGRGRRQVALKIGDVISGFTLKEIHADYIVVARGEEAITLKITDNAEKRDRTFQASETTPKVAQPPPPGNPKARGALRRQRR